MKHLIIPILLTYCIHLSAQDTVTKPVDIRPALIEFNGGMYNGNSVDVEAPVDLVEAALKDKFKAQGVKAKEIKGFLVFRNVRLSKIDAVNPLDAFVKVERKSRKEKEISTISYITSPVNQISDDKLKSGVATATVTSAALTGTLFTDLLPDIDLKVYEKSVADQQEQVKKSEKKLKELQEEQASKEKKIRNLQEELESNRKDQEAQTADLEKKRKALSDLLAQKPLGGGLEGKN
ncbi:MAG: CDK5 domain-containing protein [Bacteroidota bacterium]